MDPLIAEDPAHIGPYRLIARLGAGGMGRVYLARSEDGRTVAVKVIQAELAQNREFRARFAREVGAARKVGGKWTAPVIDADTEALTPWVATGYVPGPDLYTVVAEQHGPLPEASVRSLGGGLAQALADIHTAGMIHRDLKPSNVLVTIDGPRVIDFGIARALETLAEGAMTRTGAVIGSPGFMSPEQVRGQRLTPASDVFCLGSVLAYAATGNSPFGTVDSGLHALMFRVAEEEPDLGGVPEPLLGLVQQCLHKDPAHRPTPQEIAARTATDSDEPWLPGKLLSQLGRDAAQLLDFAPSPTPGSAPSSTTSPAAPAMPTPAPLPTPTATPTAQGYGYPSAPQAYPQPSPQPYPQPPAPAAPFPHYAPTMAATDSPNPRGRRAVLLIAAAVTAVAVVAGGLIALNLWKDKDNHNPSASGGKNTPNDLPDGFPGTFKTLAWGDDLNAQLRLKVSKGRVGDDVVELALLDELAGRLCVYSSRLTSASDRAGVEGTDVELGVSTLKRAEPEAAAKDCEVPSGMTLARGRDGALNMTGGGYLTKGVGQLEFKKDPLAKPNSELLSTFRGKWQAKASSMEKYDGFSLVVGEGAGGPLGVQFTITKGDKTCVYKTEAFSVLGYTAQEQYPLYTPPAKLSGDGSAADCAKNGPLLKLDPRHADPGGLVFETHAPMSDDTVEWNGKLTKVTG
ncbi:serine/threonine-protein kinase [Streptomyces sp. T-3]|nr:serine/threonine-protein kinase [Streptomyces sp. T-3]